MIRKETVIKRSERLSAKRKKLLKAMANSADAKAPIQAVTLRYYDGEGQRTDLPSYAEVNLFQSLWRIVSMKKICIRLDFSPQYKPTDMPDKDRYALKDIAETAIGEIVASDSPVQPLPKK